MKALFRVYLEPYTLEAGRVGEDIYQPVYVSSHRSPRAAARRLIRLIRGTDPEAREYLASVNRNGPPVALRYVARSTSAPFKAYSATDLRAL